MIFSTSDLPPSGGGQERLTLDFKALLKKERFPNGKDQWNHFEMAKDIAAFANAYGGTLLIGAQEDKATGTISGYVPLTHGVASSIKTELQNAAAQRCIPTPVLDVVVIPHQGGFVVAANVWAFPDQAVGVRLDGDENDGYAGHCFVFPLRTATNTIMLQPSSLPLIMHAQTRRAAVLVQGIPETGRKGIRVYTRSSYYDFVELIGVAATENVATLKGHKQTQALGDRMVAVPLDAVQSVWKDTVGSWAIRLEGNFFFEDEMRARWIP